MSLPGGKNRRWRVGLVDHTGFPLYLESFAGIHAYQREHPGLRFLLMQRKHSMEEMLQGFDLDAVVGNFGLPDTVETLAARKLPAVGIFRTAERIPTVTFDYVQSGRLLGEHFSAKHYRRVGFFPGKGEHFQALVRSGLAEVGQRAGFEVVDFPEMTEAGRGERTWPRYRVDLLREWLGAAEKPFALVLADLAYIGNILSVCDELDLRVPEDIALAAASGDRYRAEFTEPPLTLVEYDASSIGYEAARTIHRMLEEPGYHPLETMESAGMDLIERRSSAAYAIEDTVVRRAMQTIDTSLAEGVSVDSLAEKFRISRRTLERRFMGAIRCMPGEAIRKAREARARELLRQSSLSMMEVALECGIEHPAQLTRMVKRAFGCTPLEMRRKRDG